jgi:hypothetical protein
MLKKLAWVVPLITATAFATQAHAALTLSLSDENGNFVSVADNGAGDFNAAVGAITFIGSGQLPEWVINVQVGISKPLNSDGSTAGELLHLSSLSASSVSANGAAIRIVLEDDGFSGYSDLVFGIGGTQAAQSQVAANAGYDTSSTPGNLGVGFGPDLVFVNNSVATAAFSGSSATGELGLAGDYGVAIVAEIEHGAGFHNTSFDASISTLSEPAMLAVFGMGLMALGIASRRRLKAS